MAVLKYWDGGDWVEISCGGSLSGISTRTGTQATVTARGSASFANVDTSTDIIIPASVGDLIVVETSIYLGSEGVRLHLDVGSWVSGTSTFTHFGNSGDGAWMYDQASFTILPFRVQRVLQPSDLVSGNLTIRWRYKTNGGSNKTFGHWFPPLVTNFGPTGLTTGQAVSSNRQTGSYTLVLTDAGKVVEMNVAGANNLTVPPNSSVAFPTGTVLEIMQYGAGQTTIVAGAGVTLRSPAGNLKIAAQYGAVSLRKITTDEWAVEGNLTA